MLPNLTHVIEQVGRDKGIDKQILIEAIEAALLTAARKKLGSEREIEAHFNEDAGEVELFEFKTVVDEDEVEDESKDLTLSEALKLDPECEVGDSLGVKIDSSSFGRIAAQTAKQVIIQRVREAEREIVYNEYKDRKNELITGIARRFERGNIIVDLGRAESVLPVREQVPRESYRAGDRVLAFVKDIDREARGQQIILSRTQVGLLTKLFEMEVPEIYEGIVRIVHAAREPGSRSKIAVASRDSDVDPIGACVGMKGSRVQAVVQELRGEKIDIIPFNEDPAKFVVNAIAPADVTRVIMDEENRTMELIVPDDQLSLAIGKKGQNVRLASQLTGWRIDIHSESQAELMVERAYRMLLLIDGIERKTAQTLYKLGFQTIEDIASAENEELTFVTSLKLEIVKNIKEQAVKIMEDGGPMLSDEEEEELAELAATTEARMRGTNRNNPLPPLDNAKPALEPVVQADEPGDAEKPAMDEETEESGEKEATEKTEEPAEVELIEEETIGEKDGTPEELIAEKKDRPDDAMVDLASEAMASGWGDDDKEGDEPV